jgi:hypothetical protein
MIQADGFIIDVELRLVAYSLANETECLRVLYRAAIAATLETVTFVNDCTVQSFLTTRLIILYAGNLKD